MTHSVLLLKFQDQTSDAEMDHHLGREERVCNSSNGSGRKIVVADTGKIEIEVPRDRQGGWAPRKTLAFDALI